MAETKRELRKGIGNPHFTGTPIYDTSDGSSVTQVKIILKCVKCGDTSTEFQPCDNCGDIKELILFEGVNSKLQCRKCERTHFQTRWKCSKCGCDNPIGNSAYHWVDSTGPSGGGCFIATACYGNYQAPEVLILRNYRDTKLIKTYIGKFFVTLYYCVSPFLARIISKSDFLKKIIRRYCLTPIVKRLKNI